MPGHALSELRVLWEDGDRALCRGRSCAAGSQRTVLVALPVMVPQSSNDLDRLAREFDLRAELDSAWAVRPFALERSQHRSILVLEDPGGEPLARLLGSPLEVENFLRLAIGLAAAVGKVHQRGLVHKDLKPANIIAGCADGSVRLTGFGIASRLSRERQTPQPPETIAGTLAYIAPEQTGWTNRSVDVRSDLYALGVTLYQMLTGVLPFSASDAMEWVHCHLARKPVPPSERSQSVPAPVSGIVMRLLAKMPEERYQTAAGVERDLRRCQAEWQARHCIDDFQLGLQDTPDRLLIPERLYGREHEIGTLLDCFNRVVRSGVSELLLVSGYSGIGKSSVVHELHKALVPPRALFASGKFDQYQRDIPYATLVQAFQSLVRPLLSKNDAELAGWRQALLEALGPNGRLMIDLIPELKLIIGEQAPAPELPPQQAQIRFHLVFQRFISVFARPEHPLVLFLDDLQWLDAATLDLLEEMLTRSDVRHLMLVGAYRSNEVAASHPLMWKLEAIKAAGGKIAEIALAPLLREHLKQMITDALRDDTEDVSQLAELVYEKTGGNPFFVIQFLSLLAEEALLTFDHEQARWFWDAELIRAQRYTDNVVDLMVGRLARLPDEARNALQQLACLGNVAELATLSMVLGLATERLDATLWPALRLQLIERTAASYRFAHDRIQEAAYSLIPEARQVEEHLRIGRLLAANTPPRKRQEMIFDIVNQLNRGEALMASSEEREQLAEFNLIAGKRAKASAAYFSALKYFMAGVALLPEGVWERRGELAFALALHSAECEFLTGAPTKADESLAALRRHAITLSNLAVIARLRGEIFVTLGRIDSAVEVGLDYLRHVGIDWSAHPAREEVQQEYERLRQRLGDRPIETLHDLPRMTDPDACGTMDVLLQVAPAALPKDENLLSLVACRMANLSLEHGNSDGSCSAYVWLGTVLGPYFGDYRSGFRFAKLGLALVDTRGLERFRARAYLLFGAHVNAWTRHVQTGRPMLRRAFDVANEAGDVTFAGYSCCNLVTNLLAAGDPLDGVQREAEIGLNYAREFQYSFVVDLMASQLQLIRMLRGLTLDFGRFKDVDFDDERFELHLKPDPIASCWYWIRKLQGHYFAGSYVLALEAASNAQPLLWTSTSSFEAAEYHYYAALVRAALCDTAGDDERARHLEALIAHHGQLQEWGESCPENFENRSAVVGAEIARIEDRALDAMNLYERAIRSSRENDFVHNEAIASELAARFYTVRGFEMTADAYLRNARHCYLRWGAGGKVQQLDAMHPHLQTVEAETASMSTIAAPVERLDLATVIKVSQAVSGEIVLEKLLETLMRTAIEQAGAERGLLILSHGAEQRIAAEATTSNALVVVRLRDQSMDAGMLPESVLHYALRTGESVILSDASAQAPFSSDPYIRERQTRSVLCLPLLNQAKLIGVLFLENDLAPGVFVPSRIAVLKLLASQAAISLENTRLYRDLEEREAKIRRLVDSNVIGIVIWDLDGRLIDANDAFLRMVQHGRDDLSAGMRWFDMTPPEWQEAHVLEEAEELRTTGRMQAREKEFFRKDGTRVPVLIGAAAFEGDLQQGVAYILDLTDLKRAEAQARENEQRYREVQNELAHANRVATMGQLIGSMAHEVSQPIGATIIGAQAALHWLEREPPELGELRQSLDQILSDSTRAGEVVGRIRDLIKKAPPRQDLLEINDPIQEVIGLTRSEAMKNSVTIKADLAEGLPLIRGDRVQLQQVMLNLIINAIEVMSGDSDGARELQISTKRTGSGEILVIVCDSGPGIQPGTDARIFEAFYTTKPAGLGMGLSICRSIVEAHGGRLGVGASQPRGTVFQFTLPQGEENCARDGEAL
ncbi:hypothetical protein BWR60_00535 [Inquilinus limosus]|uniref:histidine kinase n=2 Tax=Inquilinus limosus TaxID=171674 RepID=A0A211ZV83_9PROT|nr:ATP-binding sensor histidine kinase [Inquilinus limosus]OWJ69066.1 hypothetical protein BWR60_00535 [Inquilinus limosus]